ncbi:unnamed protein product [Cylicocyclus nassatus]|uniref:Uncharacterized protein n=1 Tax=Cylicocyclus nassatus TaxID=53992 RepID=A0AA36H6P1_CYLNA|nr:unnamed protein product [Cylicocyclus nassatus]
MASSLNAGKLASAVVQVSSSEDAMRNNSLSESKPADSSGAEKREETRKMLFVYLIIFVLFIILLVGFIIYICWMKFLKRRILAETRKKVQKAVVTAGAASTSNATESSKKIKPSPRRMRSQSRESQEELKTFVCTGPIVMQAGLHGKVKHALDASTSHSLREIQFDPAHNEITLIGTDVDRIVGKSTKFSDELAQTPRRGKSTSREVVTSFKECVTQDEAKNSKEHLDWNGIKTARLSYDNRNVLPHWNEIIKARKQVNSSEEQVQNTVKGTRKEYYGKDHKSAILPQPGKTALTPRLARTPMSEPRQMLKKNANVGTLTDAEEVSASKEKQSDRMSEKSSNHSRRMKKTINVHLHRTQDDSGNDEVLISKPLSNDTIHTSTSVEQKGPNSEPHHTDRLTDDLS